MFCPECRKYWSTPREPGAADSSAKKPSNAVSATCASCGALLAPDRLVGEFPAAEQAQQAGRGLRERRMTVKDVLRETASPHALASLGSVIPLDEQEAERPKNFRTLFRRENWNQFRSRMLCRDRPRTAKTVAMDIVLGIASIAAIIVLALVVTMRVTVQMRRGHDGFTPSASASNSLTIQKIMPDNVGYNWKVAEADTILKSAQATRMQAALATYAYGSHKVRLSFERFATASAAAAGLAAIASQRRDLHQTDGTTDLSSSLETFNGEKTVVFGPSGSNTAPDAYSVDLTQPNATILPYTRSWQGGNNVYTVLSENAQDRDDFAKSYMTR